MNSELKVLHVISSCASGGAEVFVKDLSIELKKRGNDVAIAYFSKAIELGLDPNFEREFLQQLEEHQIKVFEIGHSNRRNVISGLMTLNSIFKSFDPDVVHAHLVTGLILRILTLRRVATVFTNHNIKLSFNPYLFRLFDRFVDRYVAICDACEHMLKQHTKNDVERIYNGISLNRITRGSPRQVRREIKIISVGNLGEQKNYEGLISIADALCNSDRLGHHKVTFQIVGGGHLKAPLAENIRRKKLEDSVFLLGVRRDVSELLQDAHIYLLTSHYEGFPIALIEALQSGLPIVSADVGGCGEIVTDGVNGFLIGDPATENFAKSIEAIIENPTLMTIFSANSMDKASQFSIEAATEHHLSLYQGVLDQNR